MLNIVFKILCGILYLIGLIFGLSYKDISVIVCIYGCPLICIIFALIGFFGFSYKTIFGRLWKSLNLSLFIIYTLISLCFWQHYMYYNDAFSRCKNELDIIAISNNISYEELNLFIYCGLFFGIILFHCIPYIYKLIKFSFFYHNIFYHNIIFNQLL